MDIKSDQNVSNMSINENEGVKVPSKILKFEFTGQGGEYFKIWIVNILLTIVTLGLYYPWAKVRTKNYFYGNTLLEGEAFEYHADPKTIFKGFLIAYVLIIALNFSSIISVFLPVLISLLLLFLFPWIIVRSMRFNAIMSSWRGIRFNFTGDALSACKEVIIAVAVFLFTLGLAAPYVFYRWNKFRVDNHQYGTTHFKHNTDAPEYFMNIYMLYAAMIVLYIFLSLVMAVFGVVAEGILSESLGITMIPLIIVFVVAYMVFIAVYQAMKIRLFYNNNNLATNLISNKLDYKKWVFTAFTNTFLLIITLGFYFPWAVVSVHKLIAEYMMIEANDIDDFIGHQQQHESALGQELGEALDFDLGL